MLYHHPIQHTINMLLRLSVLKKRQNQALLKNVSVHTKSLLSVLLMDTIVPQCSAHM